MMIEKLLKIQSELNVPKSEYNKFGNYNYRNVEGIQEAVKPLCLKYGLMLSLSDEIVMIGTRIYVKATAKITDGEKSVESVAYAREAEVMKGMSDPQLTGTASSYARKYALGGLLLLDDMKDDDKLKGEPVPEEKTAGRSAGKPAEKPAEDLRKIVSGILEKIDFLNDPELEAGIMKAYKKKSFDQFSAEELSKLSVQLDTKIKRATANA